MILPYENPVGDARGLALRYKSTAAHVFHLQRAQFSRRKLREALKDLAKDSRDCWTLQVKMKFSAK